MQQENYSSLWNVTPSYWVFKHFQDVEEFYKENSSKFKDFDEEIWKFYNENKQTKEEFQRKLNVRDRLSNFIADNFPNWRNYQLVITGSTVSGCGMRNSDCDVTLYIPDARKYFETDKDCCRSLLASIERKLKGDPNWNKEVQTQLIDAMVPLLKMKVSDGGSEADEPLEVDLSVTPTTFLSGVHNSRLIAGYTQVDRRFAPLVVFIKAWAAASGVKNPVNRRFNSYAITLLVIHFLQCGLVIPILPSLQALYPHIFALSEEEAIHIEVNFTQKLPELIREEPQNEMLLSELFFAFLCYYRDVKLPAYIIDIRTGALTPRGESVSTMHQNAVIYIKDPIDTHNPGRTVNSWEFIQYCFADATSLFFRACVSKPQYRFPLVCDLLSCSSDWSTVK